MKMGGRVLKSYMQRLYLKAHDLNTRNTLDGLDPNGNARLLDLGCAEGEWTMQVANALGTRDVHAIEMVDESAAAARARGIQVAQADLETRWPFPDNAFDVVHSRYVIEHMSSIDNFVAESFRVLKPGGYTITSTENGSSWHNIVAALLGWQTFSSSSCSTRAKGIGNPLALQRGGGETHPSQIHRVIFNYRGFKEIFEVHGFERVQVFGAGYHPLPVSMGRLDPRHAHFIAVKAFKPRLKVAP